jgi:putative ABC transport system substrate-binding protein
MRPRIRLVLAALALVSVLWNPASPFQVSEELDEAFEAIVRARSGALVVVADRLFLHNRARIVAFATRHRLPGVYAYRELVEAGALMSFGPSYADMHRRAATYVDRILKGAKAADLPVEQPTKLELIVNLKAARALGLTVPPSVLARADEVLQ